MSRPVRRFSSKVLDRISRDPRRAARISGLLERLSGSLVWVGARSWAGRIDQRRTGGGIATIPLPAEPGAGRRLRIRMFRLNGDDQIVRAIHEQGWRGFECPLPDVICALARRSPGQVYDVGANTGFYSLVAVTAGAELTVHAFEPARDVLPLLKRNVALCPHRSRIITTASAVSDQVGEAELYVPLPSGVVETSSSLEGGFKPEHLESYRVPVTTLDEYWRRSGSPPLSMIKIDVEGHELPALRGATDLVKQCRPVIIVEVLEGAPMQDLNTFRRDHDLVDVRISPQAFVVGDDVRWDPLAWNHLFVPFEQLDDILALLAALNLRATSVAAGPVA